MQVQCLVGEGARNPHASGPRNQNIKQRLYCNKFSEDFKNGPHYKKETKIGKNKSISLKKQYLNKRGHNGTPLQYSCLENPMDGGAWWAVVHGVPKSRTRLSDFTFTFHFPALEKEMATHSSVLAWRIPGTGEPGGLPSVGSHRVGHD